MPFTEHPELSQDAINTIDSLKSVELLPPHLVNRIAAGEVVERPASVVKELVENALDAGATQVSIMVGGGGRNLRIADNGHGMRPEDAKKAFYNHATSKIRTVEELEKIQTLGFRGEALASVASISRMVCLTRTKFADQGVKVSINEIGEPHLTEAGCAPGTVMQVDDLFYNTPARLKFLKRPQTELGHIEEVVQYLALSHPEVTFSLQLAEKEVLKTSGSGSLKKTLEELFSISRQSVKLIPISQNESKTESEGSLSLAGFVSEPGFMKSNKRLLMTFVNGRHVRCHILQKSVEAAYESLLPSGKYPLAALFLSMPFHHVDVNVHPAKREVRYVDSNRIFGFVKSALKNAMIAQGIQLEPTTPFPARPWQISSQIEASPLASVPDSQNQSLLSNVSNPSNHFDSTLLFRNSNFSENPRTVHEQNVSSDRSYPLAPFIPLGTENENATLTASIETAQIPLTQETLYSETQLQTTSNPEDSSTRFKVIGQLFNTYILLETIQGLLVLDQHIASERSFFEALTVNLTSGEPLVQKCLGTKALSVSPVQYDLLEKQKADFEKLGFTYLLQADSRAILLTGFPIVYTGRDGLSEPIKMFEQLLNQLEETGQMNLDLDHLLATLACHSAVRAGDTLNQFEMEEVIKRWLACELPWTCPHGRPIAHTISKNDLNKFFHRTSLPVGT
jgi:DNA mismatch repair protein MutL